MGKIKIPIWVKLWLGRVELKSLLTFQRILTSLVLGLFTFFTSSPSALAYFELVEVTQAAGLGGMFSSAVSGFFGKSGEILQKFSTPSDALIYKAGASNKSQFDLVAILVDEEIAKNNAAYDGLMSSFNPTVPTTPDQAYRKLTDQTLMNRIERYAKDVQGINKVVDPQPFVKTAIIKVKRNEPTEDIASTLEKFYREGDGTLGETNRLKGIVIVGQVPLPVVNKDGNRFVSLFPYTDFDDPYYIYDAKSRDFIRNSSNQKAGAEVWHGIIVPPLDGEEGNKLLAEYFDKNHLFKLGEKQYKDFDKKMF